MWTFSRRFQPFEGENCTESLLSAEASGSALRWDFASDLKLVVKLFFSGGVSAWGDRVFYHFFQKFSVDQICNGKGYRCVKEKGKKTEIIDGMFMMWTET
jgi:hypothetical protein